ncbi:DUF503 domain-containing protein [Desulfatitalea alkaliphila]|uniref:DUF503 domain-containing protein n=1 Tax=Desulfatitalea alkaliphila TaxID=2929485 RepID=A0AA41R1H1_9BACT|nr:DUF503 domain-containing protein [Desulfatitalea alkaliphila]MCJ8501152.1 DUF503 domain-containing protein [Desulfatitalea alkaliphila]
MPKRSSAQPHMAVGYGVLTFRLHDCRSLKAKRSVVRSIIGQMRNHFNAAVAEVGANDIHQRARIGFALVGPDHQVINAKMDKLINFVDGLGLAEIIDTEMEIFHL